jgi:hypothetical protein
VRAKTDPKSASACTAVDHIKRLLASLRTPRAQSWPTNI